MEKYYLAIDIGETVGKHILGHLENGKLKLEEIHRFENQRIEKGGELSWDFPYIFHEIKSGIKKCREIGKLPIFIGIDSWGADFVLLDSENKVIGSALPYLDAGTKEIEEKLNSIISEDKLYARTGIYNKKYNTIYQLMKLKESHPDYFDRAESLMMFPDYFNFLLTGIKRCEYTNATTTQLVDPVTKVWDNEMIERLGFPRRIFSDISRSGSVVGTFTIEVTEEVGYDCIIITPVTNNISSAALALPTSGQKPFLVTSGAMSYLGTERIYADCSPSSQALHFTNQGGIGNRFLYIKNILEPVCPDNNQPVAEGNNQSATADDIRLAHNCKETMEAIEEILKTTFDCIYVMGDGADMDCRNQLIAEITGKTVYAGPIEASAIGNLLLFMIISHDLKNLQIARECVRNSFEIKEYRK
jgi:rhamnulokinase